MAFLKYDRLMLIWGGGGGGGGGSQIQQFLRLLLLKITSGLKNSPEYVLCLKKLKNDINFALKPTGWY